MHKNARVLEMVIYVTSVFDPPTYATTRSNMHDSVTKADVAKAPTPDLTVAVGVGVTLAGAVVSGDFVVVAAAHSPSEALVRPGTVQNAFFNSHSLPYVFPSEPHTGLKSFVQTDVLQAPHSPARTHLTAASSHDAIFKAHMLPYV
jgi:hypothetical protein